MMKRNKAKKKHGPEKKVLGFIFVGLLLFSLSLSCRLGHPSFGTGCDDSNHFLETVIFSQAASDIAIFELKNKFHKSEVRIALLGDSISEGWNLPSASDAYPYLLLDELRKEHPNQKFSFLNASLGSRTLGHFLDKTYVGKKKETNKNEGFGAHFPMNRSWIVEGSSWIQTVKDWNPDILIVAFGVNDLWEPESIVTFERRLNKLREEISTFASKPAIILVTSLLLQTEKSEPMGANTTLFTMASVERSFAHRHNLVLVDVQRTWLAAISGVDLVSGKINRCRPYSEEALLGTALGIDGNGFNHPSKFGHKTVYFSTFRWILSKLQAQE